MISSVPPSLDLAAILLGDDESSPPFSDEELIPARMLNEFTYCPRLAYLEWVQGEFTDNLDTRQGTFGHRNVDQPSAKHVPTVPDLARRLRTLGKTAELLGIQSNPDDPKGTLAADDADGSGNVDPGCDVLQTTRALMLSAPREGLIAKLDVLELEGAVVTPVDYKKGTIPDNPHQAWEPERVQLCAQGLILRENGYTCDHGELYYIESRRRVVIPFDDALIMRTRELVKQLREMAGAARMPPPLIDSPKCPRCSLVGICLPDETNLLLQLQVQSPVPLDTTARREPSSGVRDFSGGRGSRRAVAPIDADTDTPETRATQEDQRANDVAILNPSCDAREPAVPGDAREPARREPSSGVRDFSGGRGSRRAVAPIDADTDTPETRATQEDQRANDVAILNTSCDTREPAVPGDAREPARREPRPPENLSPEEDLQGDQRANDVAILNPSCDAREPAVPGDAREPAVPVRRLLPARDDALPLYVKEQGAFVGKDGDRVVVGHRETKLVSIPLMEVSQVSLFGNVQMSAQALREIVDRGIPVCHFSYGGWFHAITTGHVQKNIELRIAQFAAAANPARSLALAKGFITAKIRNSRTMLRRHGGDRVTRRVKPLPAETRRPKTGLPEDRGELIKQPANDGPILNPSYVAGEPARRELSSGGRGSRRAEAPIDAKSDTPEDSPPEDRSTQDDQRANDVAILNPSCDAHEPARRALSSGWRGSRRAEAPIDSKTDTPETLSPEEDLQGDQRANDGPILNPSCDAGEPARRALSSGWRGSRRAEAPINSKTDTPETLSPEEDLQGDQRANDGPILNPSCVGGEPARREPRPPEEDLPDDQRANDVAILNPSCDAREPAVPVPVSALDQLAEWIEKAERATSAASLLGLEGMAAKTYFAGFSKILKGGASFDMTGRNRRPPRDPVNAVLSFTYALLTKEMTIAVLAVGFDPLLGFFHKPRYGRPSLALDLAEEFRPIIADSTAMMVINNGEVNASSFVSRAGAVALTESGRKAVMAAFERRMEQEVTHPIFGYKLTYRRVFEVQARLLSRVVLGELDTYPGFCTR